MRLLFALLWTASLQASEVDDALMFGAPATSTAQAESPDKFKSGESVENPLQIGGVFYQQLNHRGASEGDKTLSAPLQLDLFLDARPNDRIRANVTARLLYD